MTRARSGTTPHSLRTLRGLCLLLLLPAVPVVAAAQEHVHPAARSGWTAGWSAGAVPLLTHAAPAVAGEARTELYLTQPFISAGFDRADGRLMVRGVLNLEGLTLARGELTPGVWGEGYVDRRHPHTYLHELIAVARVAGGPAAPAELTLAAGKGFAPFGSDDPMVRPFVKFPANHHLAHVLERLVAVAALRVGPVIAELGAFNGDEPDSPRHLGSPERFGDSWSVRGTVLPAAGWELATSRAFVASPEFPAGSSIDHHKSSATARHESGRGGSGRYLLLEWARTEQRVTGERFQTFDTWLAEAAVRRAAGELALRVERTTRPEEERTEDPFRTPVPHPHVHLIGATRWHIVTAAAARELWARGPLRARGFVEVMHARPTETLGSHVFEPRQWYGAERLWNLSLGVRLSAGDEHRRMGRYGAALAAPGH